MKEGRKECSGLVDAISMTIDRSAFTKKEITNEG